MSFGNAYNTVGTRHEEGEELFSEYFRTTRIIPVSVPDLTPVGEDVMSHFAAQGYTVSASRLANGGWYLSLYKGDWFRLILGLKTALNVRIEPDAGGTYVSAGIGIFELQALPLVIAAFVFAPVILGQIWGVIQQNKLDEEAVHVVEDRLAYYGGIAGVSGDFAGPAAPTDV